MRTIISSYYDYLNEEMNCEMIVGFGYEIKPIYKSIKRAIKKGSTTIRQSLCTNSTEFNLVRTYALYIDEKEYINILTAEDIVTFFIINGRDIYYKEKEDQKNE